MHLVTGYSIGHPPVCTTSGDRLLRQVRFAQTELENIDTVIIAVIIALVIIGIHPFHLRHQNCYHSCCRRNWSFLLSL